MECVYLSIDKIIKFVILLLWVFWFNEQNVIGFVLKRRCLEDVNEGFIIGV